MHATINFTVGGSSAVDIVLTGRWSLISPSKRFRWSIIGNGLAGRWSLFWPALISVDRSSETVWRGDDRSSDRHFFPLIDHRKQFGGEMIALMTGTFFRWSIIGNSLAVRWSLMWNCFFRWSLFWPALFSEDRSSEQSAGHKSDHLPAKLFPMIDHLTVKLIQMSDHLTAKTMSMDELPPTVVVSVVSLRSLCGPVMCSWSANLDRVYPITSDNSVYGGDTQCSCHTSHNPVNPTRSLPPSVPWYMVPTFKHIQFLFHNYWVPLNPKIQVCPVRRSVAVSAGGE